jgi:hypothetical protein
MEKKLSSNKIYRSKNILGQLYDLVQKVDFEPHLDTPFDQDILSAFDLDPTFLSKARRLKAEYDWDIKRIMTQHAIKTEFEVFSTFVMSHNQEKNDYKLAEELGMIALSVKDKFREECINAAGGSGDERLHPFVAAMYSVTAEEVAIFQEQKNTISGWTQDAPLISFPWIFDKQMNEIKSMQKGTSTITSDQGINLQRQHTTESTETVPCVPEQHKSSIMSRLASETGESSDGSASTRVNLPTGPSHRGELLTLFDDTEYQNQPNPMQHMQPVQSPRTHHSLVPASPSTLRLSAKIDEEEDLISFEEDISRRIGSSVGIELLSITNECGSAKMSCGDSSDSDCSRFTEGTGNSSQVTPLNVAGAEDDGTNPTESTSSNGDANPVVVWTQSVGAISRLGRYNSMGSQLN